MTGYLYVVLRPSDGARKVGQSINPAARLIGINNEQAMRCSIEYQAECPVDSIDAAEGHAHALLWDGALGREWFAVDQEAARAAVDAAIAAALADGPMLKPPKPTVKYERLEMRVDLEWLKRLDDWRRQQDDLPTRAEALRRLTAIGLAADP
jgi:hypothetical protein